MANSEKRMNEIRSRLTVGTYAPGTSAHADLWHLVNKLERIEAERAREQAYVDVALAGFTLGLSNADAKRLKDAVVFAREQARRPR